MLNRVRNWFRSLSAGQRNALLAGVALIGVLVVFSCSGESPEPQEPLSATAPQVPETASATAPQSPGTASTPPIPRKSEVPPEYALAAAQTYLRGAWTEGEMAIGVSIGEIDKFFAERRDATRVFAKAVLDIGGKAAVLGNLAAEVVNGVSEMLGQGRVIDQHQLARHIKDCFVQHVLDETRLQKALETAVEGYMRALGDIESRLIVDIRADLADDALAPGEMPPMRTEAGAVRVIELSLDEMFDTAAIDLFMGMGKFAASWVGGDMLGGSVVSGDANPLVRFGGNFAAGSVVDQGIDAATEALGYKPEEDIALKAQRILAGIEFQAVEGTDQAREDYFPLLDLSLGYPDETVRAECRQAVDVMEKRATIGLRMRLHKLNVDRDRLRSAVIYRHIFGQDAALPQEILPLAIDPKRVLPADQLIEKARHCVALFGGRKL
jgi:hypothetical protein